MTDEAAIRELITRWADAVHTGDLDTVLADHDPDIVMFDVPPPYDGVRGIDAYRDYLAAVLRVAAPGRVLRDRRTRRDGRRRRRVRLRAAALR